MKEFPFKVLVDYIRLKMPGVDLSKYEIVEAFNRHGWLIRRKGTAAMKDYPMALYG